MFLEKYLNDIYLDMLYEKYEEWYLNQLDETNFISIYNLFQKYGFYFLPDIIVNYLELFEYEYKEIEEKLLHLKDELGDEFISKIGNHLTYLVKLFEDEN